MKNKRISIMISRNKNRYLFVSAAKIDEINNITKNIESKVQSFHRLRRKCKINNL